MKWLSKFSQTGVSSFKRQEYFRGKGDIDNTVLRPVANLPLSALYCESLEFSNTRCSFAALERDFTSEMQTQSSAHLDKSVSI